MFLCEVQHCNNFRVKTVYCNKHYLRNYRYGNPLGGPPIKLCADKGCEHLVRVATWCGNHKRKYIPALYLLTVYGNMKKRINGTNAHSKRYPHLYKGKFLLGRKEFVRWARTQEDFTILFINWIESGHNQLLSPSIDRIDNDKGYEINNMRWITAQENKRNGAISRWSKNE